MKAIPQKSARRYCAGLESAPKKGRTQYTRTEILITIGTLTRGAKIKIKGTDYFIKTLIPEESNRPELGDIEIK